MRTIAMSVLLLVALPATLQAQQATLPPDIHPVTLSRLPPVTPEDLDEEGRRLLAARQNFTPGPGPTHVTVYSPRDRSLGVPTGENSPIGARQFQLAVLIAAREIDQQYEWSAHEPAGLRQGLEQSPFVEAFYVWSAVSPQQANSVLVYKSSAPDTAPTLTKAMSDRHIGYSFRVNSK